MLRKEWLLKNPQHCNLTVQGNPLDITSLQQRSSIEWNLQFLRQMEYYFY